MPNIYLSRGSLFYIFLAIVSGLGGTGLIKTMTSVYVFGTFLLCLGLVIFFLKNKIYIHYTPIFTIFLLLNAYITFNWLFFGCLEPNNLITFLFSTFSCIGFASINWGNRDLKSFSIVVVLYIIIAYYFGDIQRAWPQYYFYVAIIGLLSSHQSGKKSYILLFLTLLSLFVTVSTLSRISIAGTFVSICVFVFLSKLMIKYRFIYRFTYLFFILLPLLFPIIYITLYEIYGYELNTLFLNLTSKRFFNGREILWGMLLNYIKASPILGHGGSTPPLYIGTRWYATHNLYLECLYRYGGIGLIIYLSYFIIIFEKVYRNFNDSVTRFCVIAFFGILVQQSFELSLISPISFILPNIILGIALGRTRYKGITRKGDLLSINA